MCVRCLPQPTFRIEWKMDRTWRYSSQNSTDIFEQQQQVLSRQIWFVTKHPAFDQLVFHWRFLASRLWWQLTYTLYVHLPKIWGRWISHFDLRIFFWLKMGWFKPTTNKDTNLPRFGGSIRVSWINIKATYLLSVWGGAVINSKWNFFWGMGMMKVISRNFNDFFPLGSGISRFTFTVFRLLAFGTLGALRKFLIPASRPWKNPRIWASLFANMCLGGIEPRGCCWAFENGCTHTHS